MLKINRCMQKICRKVYKRRANKTYRESIGRKSISRTVIRTRLLLQSKKDTRKKAFIFSLDAIFAIVISGLIILSCYFFLSKTSMNIYQNQDIYKISLDSLTALEKDSTLKTAVESSNITVMQQFLDSLPNQHCGNITLYDSKSSVILSAQKNSCISKNETVVVYRNFIINNKSAYYARLEGWYR